ncbi:secreted RxLR effector protein 161-like [Lathyrus oleraceus]|uniref:secreted RxLR effector protein 161-like n=1 Tax=Pisum sativum TaxID=3888 RepID=UPI0021D19E74|nr:secreted RxLR effector protein 161-like [Pisum sativum]
MDDTIFISQSKYAKNILKKCGLDSASHKRTLTITHLKLTKDEKCVDVNQRVCARYQAEPKINHITQVNSILKYINGTSEYGMLYSYSDNSMLVGYCDADWACNTDDRKSTSGGCFLLGNNLISWFSKKQNCVSLSTDEAEYIAAGSSCSELIWKKKNAKEI